MDLLASKHYCLITYGCQMNEADSERYAGQLEELGYTMTEDWELADVILINTCCVRETAEDKVLGKIGELKHVKARNKNLILAVTGCMAQEWQDRLLSGRPTWIWSSARIIYTSSSSSLKSGKRRNRFLAADMGESVFHDIPTKRFQKFLPGCPS